MAIEKQRRALSNVGGPVETWGDPSLCSIAARALEVRADETRTMAHVHGFHSYPARLHPETAARLIEGLSNPKQVVFDPFCGSGSVLVEAHRLGRAALGTDLNPLAIELAWLKTRAFDENERHALIEASGEVMAHATARKKKKAGPTRPYGPEDRRLFEVHVLLELDGIASGIALLHDGDTKRALRVVLSAVLGKVSKRQGDTTDREVSRRIAGGFTIQFFGKKTDELVARMSEYRTLVRADAPPVQLAVGDARQTGLAARRAHLVVSSPPYPGVYDYYAQHVIRLRWLGLDARRFEKAEIGARRFARGRSHADAVKTWQKELGACLAELARVLDRRGIIALVLADTAIAGRALRADVLTAELAEKNGLVLAARASQEREHFHLPSRAAFQKQPRKEHVLLLMARER
jgi:hypothetical protein